MQNVVVFLDIDGVLTSLRTHRSYGEMGTADRFDPAMVAFLKRTINNHPQLKLVLSTSWRRFYNPDMDQTLVEGSTLTWRGERPVDMLRCRFEIEGLEERFFHEDYHTKLERTKFHADNNPDARDNEIAEWLSRHPEAKQFIILDDEYILRQELRPFWIETTWEDGMQFHHYKKFEKLLEEFGVIGDK